MKRSGRRRNTDLELAGRWYRVVVNRGAVCAACGGRQRLQAHHVIPQQVLRRYAAEMRLSVAETQAILWDVRNGIALCVRCHERHTNAVVRFPRARLPKLVWAFAQELDGRYWPVSRQPMQMRLEREYAT